MNKTRFTTGFLLTGLIAVGLSVATPAQAASPVSLKQAVRMQMLGAQQNIQAQQLAALKDTTRGIDNPGVTVGPITIIETASAEQTDTYREKVTAKKAPRVTADAALAQDILEKALRSPGLMGVSRLVALSALEMAIEAAE